MIDPTKWNYILQLDTIKLYPIRRYGMKSSTTLELKKGLNEKNNFHTHTHTKKNPNTLFPLIQ